MIFALAVALAPAEAVTFTLDPARSTLFVVVRNDPTTLAGRLGNDHVVSAESFTGTVTWDPDDASVCAVDIRFPITALAIDPPGLRARGGIDPSHDPGANRTTIHANLSSKRQLWAERFPEIRYRATSCRGTTGRVSVTGELTIRGVGRSTTVPMQVEVSETTFSASGRFFATHTDFGFDPYTNLVGALRNQDQLEFVIDVRGTLAR